ncbi:MAG: ROK family protein [Allobaculum sp.]|nr:ROK family protein [Allobaculum sp.]
MKYSVGIDIGGSNTRVALIDEDLNVVERIQFKTNTTDPNETLKKIASIISSFNKDIVGIGISCPGPLDLETGYILRSPNLGEKWWTLSIPETITKLTGLPCALENDANLATLAEAVVGDGKDKRYVQFLTISTGVGSGQVIDKKIYNGAHGFAHEIANCILWKDGPQHGLVIPGGVEAICSGTAITNRAKKAGLDVKHAGEVNALAEAGNETALAIMEDAKEYLANMIATIIAITDPEIVILGGSVAMKIKGFVKDVEDRVKTKVFAPIAPYVDIRPSSLSEDSGLIGAGYLAFDQAKAAEKIAAAQALVKETKLAAQEAEKVAQVAQEALEEQNVIS